MADFLRPYGHMHLRVWASTHSETRGRPRAPALRELLPHGIGSGVYDIHSPRVPSTDELAELIERAATALPLRQVWVNPDCGLKTRAYPETVASLSNLVEATLRVRTGLRVTV